MKNSKKYSQEVQKLYRSLKRRYQKPQTVTYDEPAEALVYAIVSENMTETATRSAIKRFVDYFIDLNDLRVSRAEEIIEILGEDTPATRDTAFALTTALRAVFDKYNMVSLQALRKIGKRPARELLEKMDGTTRFAIDYCMLTSLQGHAIPLTKKMIEYLKTNLLVHPDADPQQIEGFLARQIPAKNAYGFYALLRRESESRRAGRKKKTVRKAKTESAAKTKKQPASN